MTYLSKTEEQTNSTTQLECIINGLLQSVRTWLTPAIGRNFSIMATGSLKKIL